MDVPHLRRFRQQAILSQQQLAQDSGVARDTVSKLETGQRQAYPKTIHSLAASLGVEPQELVGNNEADSRAEIESPAQPEDDQTEESSQEKSSEEKTRRRAGF